jgi:hypothetical protein
MKKLIYLLFILPCAAHSQTIDYNRIILPENASSISFEEKLVQLAWKNQPASKELLQNVKMFGREKKLASLSWLDNLTGTFNANQFTLDPQTDVLGRGAFYPKYNFSVRFTIGTFFLTPIQTKIANDRLINGEHQVNQMKITLRSEVLSNMELLKERYKVLRLRDRLKEDFMILYKDAEKKFSNGEIKLDQYQLASQAYYGRAEAVISASSLFSQSKIRLEALIGLQLDYVEGYAEFLNLLESEIKLD